MSRVHIEFKRVQTWLFEVPRLSTMVGANTLLGQVLRYELPKLARREETQANRALLKTGFWQLKPLADAAHYPSAIADDPLADYDNPQDDALHGILSRDGGHFEADFERGEERFIEAAASLVRALLPGLRLKIECDGQECSPQVAAEVSFELPVLTPCEWSGGGLASATLQKSGDLVSVSLDVKQRYQTSQETKIIMRRRDETKLERLDLASLMLTQSSLNDYELPSEFNELVKPGYLALIHADGNGVGSALPAGASDSARARFFHQTRSRLRRALKVAFDTHAPALAEDSGSVKAPIVPLMLGGDDLLVACRADLALDFVTTLSQALADQQKDDTGFKLTLGIGVIFAKPNIPIHRLHHIAEELASSAKQRYRSDTAKDSQACHSVVDWAVYSTSWVDSPTEMRKRDWVKYDGESTRILSKRPLRVLGEGLDSLQGLIKGAETLKGVPRSQLRYLADQLPYGEKLSELAFVELVEPAKKAFGDLGCNQVWEKAGPHTRLTSVLDVIEVLEIGRLGRKSQVKAQVEGGAHV